MFPCFSYYPWFFFPHRNLLRNVPSKSGKSGGFPRQHYPHPALLHLKSLSHFDVGIMWAALATSGAGPLDLGFSLLPGPIQCILVTWAIIFMKIMQKSWCSIQWMMVNDYVFLVRILNDTFNFLQHLLIVFGGCYNWMIRTIHDSNAKTFEKMGGLKIRYVQPIRNIPKHIPSGRWLA